MTWENPYKRVPDPMLKQITKYILYKWDIFLQSKKKN